MPIRPLIDRPRTLSGQVADYLRNAIVNGELALGEMLSEESLASSLQVSRTPVREAISQLQMQGLVHVIPQKGTFVFSPTATDVVELCEFRLALEQKALQLALERNREALIESLSRAVDIMRGAIERRDTHTYAQADADFHDAFFDFSGNQYLRSAYLLASGRVAALRSHLAADTEGEHERSFDEHQQMVMLAKAGEFARLLELLVQHVMRTEANFRSSNKAIR